LIEEIEERIEHKGNLVDIGRLADFWLVLSRGDVAGTSGSLKKDAPSE